MDKGHNSVELKPCPFCGGEAEVIRGWRYDYLRPMFKICCKRCQVRQGLHKTRIGAIADWNRRVK